jgi:phosphatidate phosphatase PAH1
MKFHLKANKQIIAEAPSLRLWNLQASKIVISDVDGTMTSFEYGIVH